MSYYKVVSGGTIIDALTEPVWVCVNTMGLIVRCSIEDAIGVVASDGNTIYHIAYRRRFPNGTYTNVTMGDISEAEYDELSVMLGLGETITDDISGGEAPEETEVQEPENVQSETTEELPRLTAAEMRRKIAELEEQNSFLTECVLEISQVLYA